MAEASADNTNNKVNDEITNFTAVPSDGKVATDGNKPKAKVFTNHIYDSPDLLKGLKLAAFELDKDRKQASIEDVEKTSKTVEVVVSDRMLCSYCNMTFVDRNDQKQHYKSDWHRFNLKQKLKGTSPVSLEKFEEITAGDISSISGSDSDTESDEDPSQQALRARSKLSAIPGHVRRGDSPRSSGTDSDDEMSYHIEGIGRRHPRVFFRNADEELVSVYRCVIHGKKNQPESAEDLVTMATRLPEEMSWLVIMVAGGHFAAGVFQRGEVVEHKTFHRYVVRAKRGTIQSSRDGQGNAPKSAGASIRREQEKHLTEDIKSLLESWSEHVKSCHRIFLRATGSSRNIFFSGKSAPLSKSDSRVRMIPFPTRRPTHKELQRVHGTLAAIDKHGKGSGLTDFIPVSPKRSKAKAPATSSTDRGSPHHSPRRAKPRQPDVAKLELSIDGTGSSAEEGEVTLGFQDETMDLTQHNQFEVTKKPRRKTAKKSGSGGKHQKSPANDIIDEELYHVRNALYTACKTGNLTELETVLATSTPTPGAIVSPESETSSIQSPQSPQDQSEASLNPPTSNIDQSASILPHAHATDQIESTLKLAHPTDQSNAAMSSSDIQINQSKSCDVIVGQSESSDVIVSQSEEALVKNSPNQLSEHLSSIGVNDNALPKPVSSEVLNMAFGDNGTTLLHVVSRENRRKLVATLLAAGADPAIKDKNGTVPYLATTNKETRNEFRKFMAKFPEKYDYEVAKIPGPLTDEMDTERKIKEAEKKKQQRKAKKERQKEQKAVESVVRAEEAEKKRYTALSDREKRALAAERRLATQYTSKGQDVPAISRCFLCGVDMTGKVPFEYSDNKFCTTKCLKEHRTKKS